MVRLHEAADMVGLSYMTLWRAAKDGHLSVSRKSPMGKYKVRLVDLREWMSKRQS